MNRYFDFPEDKKTLMVDVKTGSAAARASAERISLALNQTGAVREIDRAEYLRLTRAYTDPNVSMVREPGREG